jgi:predicted Zn finger-like uncharacterized protein
MDVQCERCKTEYEFDDALVSGRGTTVRCTHCGHQFKVRRAEGGDASGDRWLVETSDGQQFTFVTLRELQRAILARQVSRGDRLRRAGAPPRSLGSIGELEPFFEGRTSSTRPPPDHTASGSPDGASAAGSRSTVATDPGVPSAFPKRSSITGEDAGPLPDRRTTASASHAEVGSPTRRQVDTLRPPPSAVAAPPQAAEIEPQPILSATPHPGASVLLAPAPAVVPRRAIANPSDAAMLQTSTSGLAALLEASSPLPPPTQPVRSVSPSYEYEQAETQSSTPPSFEEPYSMRRGRRVGGWIVALVLLLAVGVLGWAVARPYLAGRNASPTAQIDPRAEVFLSDGEKALADGNLEAGQEDLDKASALAESDPRVRLDEARIATLLADVPWLKLKLLEASTGSADELRMTKAQVQERVGRANRLADAALASSPDAPAAFRVKIDALRLAGHQDSARGYVAKIIGQASQSETAYVLAALDLAEPEPLWTTVIERLRLSAAGEGNVGRARAALVYSLAKSGNVADAKLELAKLDSLPRPYPLLPSLHAFVDKPPSKTVVDSAPEATAASSRGSVGASAVAPPASQTSAAPAPASPGGGPISGDTRSAMQAAAQAYKKGEFERARQIYQAVVTRSPSDSEAIAALGDVARAEGDAAAAISSYKRAIAVNPSYLPALLGLADTQWSSGDRAGATRGYQYIADRFPEGTYPAYVKTRGEGATPGGSPTPNGTATPAPSPATDESTE